QTTCAATAPECPHFVQSEIIQHGCFCRTKLTDINIPIAVANEQMQHSHINKKANGAHCTEPDELIGSHPSYINRPYSKWHVYHCSIYRHRLAGDCPYVNRLATLLF